MNEDSKVCSFVLVRHGETTANAAQVASGSDSDPDLTPHGRQQMYAGAEVLKRHGEIPETILCSANKRSVESANILHECFGAPITTDSKLNERRLGEWNHMRLETVNPMMVRGDTPRGGESRPEFRKRFLGGLAKHHQTILNSRVAFVGSRGTARLVLEMVNAENAAFFPNGGIIRVTIANTDRLEVIGANYLS